MSTTPLLREAWDQRSEALGAFDLNQQQALWRNAPPTQTQSTTLPASLLEQLPLTPEDGDMAFRGCSLLERAQGLSGAIAHLLLTSDSAIVTEVHQTTDASCKVQRPFGLEEIIYPVRTGTRLTGILWGGKYNRSRPTDAGIKRYAAQTRIDEAAIRQFLDGIPDSDPGELTRWHRQMDLIQQSMVWALDAEQRFHELNIQLVEQEHTQALGTISSGVAHHFNNLLSVILGYSSFLLNRSETTGEAAEPLRLISEAAQKGRRLTEEILAFAGSEAEKESVCSVHDILDHACSLLASQVSGHIRFKHAFAAPNDHVRAPRSVLHQTLYNLLSNSIDSLPEGGDLTIRTTNESAAADKTPAACIRIEVIDSNASTEAIEAIMAEPPRKGSGNKWSRLDSMVNQLDGSTSVSPGHSIWNRAEITLPLEEVPLAGVRDTKPRKRLAPSLIWIVDDDPIFCEMCKRVLEEDGHQVVSMESGTVLQAAWDAADSHPHLLIIDFSMPEYNGLELCQWLKERGSRAPVILVSGFSHNQPDIHKALKLRKTYFLQKPFPVPELADVVSVALGETLLGQ